MKNGCVQMFAKRCAHCRIKDECCPLYFRVMKVSVQHLFLCLYLKDTKLWTSRPYIFTL